MSPDPAPTGTKDASGGVTPTKAWYIVGVLALAYTFSFIDRSILGLMVGPVRADLNISDTQFSLLHGLAFALFYTLLGIPIARLADATNRRNLIAAGIALWSLMTAACGLARSFGQLFLARVGVGIGEAALSPAAYSMIADIFPKKKLGRALGIYSSGVYLGTGLAFALGGVLVASIADGPPRSLPLIGEVAPWQLTFLIVGLPGLLVALLMFTFAEPPRPTRDGRAQGVPLKQVLETFNEHRATYLLHFVGFSMLTLLFNGTMAWVPEYFIRIHGLERGTVGLILGLIVMTLGSAGIIAGGLLSDRLSARGDLAAPINAALFGTVCLLPLGIAAPLVGSANLSLILFAPLLFFSSFPFGPAATALQLVTPPNRRAQISALYLFVVNLTGIGIGSTVTALFTDYVYRDDLKLHYSMATVSAIGGGLAIVLLMLLRQRFAASMRAAEQAAEPGS